MLYAKYGGKQASSRGVIKRFRCEPHGLASSTQCLQKQDPVWSEQSAYSHLKWEWDLDLGLESFFVQRHSACWSVPGRVGQAMQRQVCVWSQKQISSVHNARCLTNWLDQICKLDDKIAGGEEQTRDSILPSALVEVPQSEDFDRQKESETLVE